MDEFNKACCANRISDKTAYFDKFGMAYDADDEHYLKFVPLSVLSKYWEHLQPEPGNHNTMFIKGANINSVITSYLFDKEFKSLMMEAIQEIEVSLKSICVEYIYKYTNSHYSLKNNSNSWAWVDKECIDFEGDIHDKTPKKFKVFKELPSKINNIISREKGNDLDYFIIEKMSFGDIKSIYEISHESMQRDIRSYYSTDLIYCRQFKPLLYAINIIRNISAHYGCVWNRCAWRIANINDSNHALYSVVTRDKYNEGKIYNVLVWVVYILSKIDSKNKWKQKFLELTDKYEEHNYTKGMGFPDNWRSMDFWSV